MIGAGKYTKKAPAAAAAPATALAQDEDFCCWISVGRAALELVMRNLIANSIAHRDGSQGQVVLSATQGGDWVEVTVRDDGPGISEKIADQLQMAGDAVEANGDSSLGLGLTVVQRLVDRYGGRIRVDSDASGAVIHFTWPRSTENSTPPDNR